MFSKDCHGKGLYFLSFKCISIFPPSKHPTREIAKRKYRSLWHLILKIHSPVFTAWVSNKFHDPSWLPVWRYNTWIIYTLSPIFFFVLLSLRLRDATQYHGLSHHTALLYKYSAAKWMDLDQCPEARNQADVWDAASGSEFIHWMAAP